MSSRRFVAASVALLTAPSLLHAQIAVQDIDSGITPEELAMALAGPGVVVSNVVFTGASSAAGLFTGGTDAVGFDAGVVLGTGNVGFVVPVGGLNNDDGVSQGNSMPGDPDLDPFVPSFGTFDASVLEFDFECGGEGTLAIEYVLASEEYNEFVNGFYNDAFAIFVNGVNVALLPDGVTPVSINTVNGGNPIGVDAANPAFFINNDCDDLTGEWGPCVPAVPIEMDGLTVVLVASAPLLPGTNHVKIAIADGGDVAFDSNVFVRAGSISCAADPEPVDPGCVETAAFWKAHAELWPLDAMAIGNHLYTLDEAETFLKVPTRGNGLSMLVRQLVAARLNAANGAAVPEAIEVAMDAADEMIGDRVPRPFGSGRLRVRQVLPLVIMLADYNAGSFPDGPPSCNAQSEGQSEGQTKRDRRNGIGRLLRCDRAEETGRNRDEDGPGDQDRGRSKGKGRSKSKDRD